jgi:hypothetical protein
MDFAIEVGFFALHILGFPGRELAGLDAVGDAVLLILAALIYSGGIDSRGIDDGGVLREGDGTTEKACCLYESIEFHFVSHSLLLEKRS